MLITKECEYGVRIVRALSNNNVKTMQTIANEEKIPYDYTYLVAHRLVRAGFLRSLRGRNGGFQLAKGLESITMADIILAVDNKRYVSGCVCEDFNCSLKNKKEKCTVHLEFVNLQNMLMTGLRSKTMDKVLFGENQAVAKKK